MSRLVCIAVCALGLQFCSGCIFPYAYPKLAYTPATPVVAPPSEIHAFRVDYWSASADLGALDTKAGVQQFAEIPLKDSATVPAQFAPSIEYGFYLLGGALNYFVHSGHTVSVKVYCPGYKLKEIGSWAQSDSLEWEPAPDLISQEQALDQLFPENRINLACRLPDHLDALAFGATEYERLATLVPESDDGSQLTRLQNKAARLKAWVNDEPRHPSDQSG